MRPSNLTIGVLVLVISLNLLAMDVEAGKQRKKAHRERNGDARREREGAKEKVEELEGKKAANNANGDEEEKKEEEAEERRRERAKANKEGTGRTRRDGGGTLAPGRELGDQSSGSRSRAQDASGVLSLGKARGELGDSQTPSAAGHKHRKHKRHGAKQQGEVKVPQEMRKELAKALLQKGLDEKQNGRERMLPLPLPDTQLIKEQLPHKVSGMDEKKIRTS